MIVLPTTKIPTPLPQITSFVFQSYAVPCIALCLRAWRDCVTQSLHFSLLTVLKISDSEDEKSFEVDVMQRLRPAGMSALIVTWKKQWNKGVTSIAKDIVTLDTRKFAWFFRQLCQLYCFTSSSAAPLHSSFLSITPPLSLSLYPLSNHSLKYSVVIISLSYYSRNNVMKSETRRTGIHSVHLSASPGWRKPRRLSSHHPVAVTAYCQLFRPFLNELRQLLNVLGPTLTKLFIL